MQAGDPLGCGGSKLSSWLAKSFQQTSEPQLLIRQARRRCAIHDILYIIHSVYGVSPADQPGRKFAQTHFITLCTWKHVFFVFMNSFDAGAFAKFPAACW